MSSGQQIIQTDLWPVDGTPGMSTVWSGKIPPPNSLASPSADSPAGSQNPKGACTPAIDKVSNDMLKQTQHEVEGHHLRMDKWYMNLIAFLFGFKVSSQSAAIGKTSERVPKTNVDPKPGALMMKKHKKTKECLKVASKTCADFNQNYILYLFIIFKYVYGSQLHI